MITTDSATMATLARAIRRLSVLLDSMEVPQPRRRVVEQTRDRLAVVYLRLQVRRYWRAS